MKLTGRIPLLNYTKGETKNQHIIPSFYWNVHKWMILEMVILLFHSLPFVNFNFETSYQGFYLAYKSFSKLLFVNNPSIDIILSVAMNVRVYLLVRLVKHYSKWMNKDAEAVW